MTAAMEKRPEAEIGTVLYKISCGETEAAAAVGQVRVLLQPTQIRND